MVTMDTVNPSNGDCRHSEQHNLPAVPLGNSKTILLGYFLSEDQFRNKIHRLGSSNVLYFLT